MCTKCLAYSCLLQVVIVVHSALALLLLRAGSLFSRHYAVVNSQFW